MRLQFQFLRAGADASAAAATPYCCVYVAGFALFYDSRSLPSGRGQVRQPFRMNAFFLTKIAHVYVSFPILIVIVYVGVLASCLHPGERQPRCAPTRKWCRS